MSYRQGVGIMLFNQQGLVWVGMRLDSPGSWQMPQGGIDPGEEPVNAVFREMVEEVGTDRAVVVAESKHWYSYDLPDVVAVKLWNGKYKGQKQKWFLLRFTGDDSDINVHTAHPEFAQWQWLSLSELPFKIVEFKRALYQEVIAEFAPIIIESI